MIYLLLIFLIIEAFLFYVFNGRKIISPSFISCGMFVFSSCFYALYKDSYYGSDICAETVLTILFLLLFIFLGEMFAKKVRFIRHTEKKEVNPDSCLLPSDEIRVSTSIVLLFTVATLFAGFMYFNDVYKFSLLVGNTKGNIFTMTDYVRHAKNYGTGKVLYSTSTLISQLNVFSECVMYTFLYIFFRNLLFASKKNFKLLLPCVGYLLYIFACDSRSNIICNLTIICIIVFYLMNKKGIYKKNLNKKILKIGTLVVVSFMFVFRFLGYRTGTSNNYSFIINVVKYASSGIYGLNYYIMEGKTSSSLFGENVFRLIYMKLNSFGCHFSLGSANNTFYYYTGGESNIYTGLTAVLKDFGLFGAAAFVFLWAVWIQIVQNKLKTCRFKLYRLVGLGLLYFPIIMISIGGEWKNILSVTSLYILFYISVFDYLIIRRKISFKCRK